MAQSSADLPRQRLSNLLSHPESVYAMLAEWGIYLIGFVLPLTYYPDSAEIYGIPKVTMLRVLTIIILGALVLRAVHLRRISIPRTPIDWPILAFVVISLASSFQGVSWSAAIFGANVRSDGLLTFVNVAILCYVTVGVLRGSEMMKRALFGISLASLLVSIEGVAEYFNRSILGQPSDYFDFRVFSTMGNPDFLGGYLVMTVPITAGLIIMSRGVRGRAFWSFTLLVSLLALFYSFTRGAWISMVFVALVYAVFQRKMLWANKWWFGGVAILIAVMIISSDAGWLSPLRYTAPPAKASSSGQVISESGQVTSAADNADGQQGGLAETATETANAATDAALKDKQDRLALAQPSVNTVKGSDRLKSIVNPEYGGAGRVWIWQAAVQDVAEHPIIGTGYSSVYATLTKYYTMDWVRTYPTLWIDKIHNDLLEIAVNTGLLGLGAYLWAMVALVLAVVRVFRKRGWTRDQVLVAAAFSWLGYMAQTMFMFGTVDTLPIFWITIGICLGIAQQEKDSARKITLPSDFLSKAGIYLIVLVGGGFLIYQSALVQLSEIYLLRAMQEGARHQSMESMSDYLTAVNLAPTSEDVVDQAASSLGQISLFIQDEQQRRHLLDESILLWNKVIDSHPQFAQLYQLRAETYMLYSSDHVVDAYNDFKRAVELYPLYTRALGGLADTSRATGRLPEAIIAERQLVAINPKDVVAQQQLAQDYFTSGRWNNAIAAWQKVAELKGDSPSLRYWTAQAYFRSGNKEKATEEIKAALNTWPDDSQLRTALDELTKDGSDN